MEQKRGQAAMEFLMTYGWAILAAVIAIGVLAYFGVFSPGKYTSGSAIVNPPYYASAWNVKPAGVTIELTNNGGEDYTISNVTISGCGSNDATVSSAAGSKTPILVSCGTAPVVGQNFKGDITISYTKTGSTVALTSTGTIAEKITA